MKVIQLNEVQRGDIIQIKSLARYEEDGDEPTELVKKFAGQMLFVKKVVEEDGEKVYSAFHQDLGSCSFKDYEIFRAYRAEVQ